MKNSINKSALWLVTQMNAPANGKLLYLLLLDNTGKNSDSAKIRQKDFARALHISQSTVSNNLRRLRDEGYITIAPSFTEYGGRSANIYTLV